MDTYDDIDVDDLQSTVYAFPPSVQSVIEKVLPSSDPLDQPNFNTIDYINSLFPTEQALSNIDDVMGKMQYKIHCIDREIRSVVHGQTNVSQDGRAALEDAQKAIRQLFVHIKDIKDKAEKSEETVKEITRDIKQLDFAKRNLTASITALNHLHMLVDGADSLKILTEKKKYGEIVLPLQAIVQVLQNFSSYMDIPQIKQLSDQVSQIQVELAHQITADFKQAFTGQNPNFVQLTEGSLVLDVLDPKVKKELLSWFVNMQLQEYVHLFDENQDAAWLDKIDKRYAWIKKHLLNFESKFQSIFPDDWVVSERIAVQFCHVTYQDIAKLMQKRRPEIDVKLLLYAIQRTANFENLLTKRFSGITLEENSSESSSQIQNSERTDSEKIIPSSPFTNLIGKAFEPYLNIYIESLDRNLSELMDKFVADCKTQPPGSKDFDGIEGPSSVLSSCADLFVFYKKCMLQCTQLSTGSIMLNLSETFKKYLREYALKILQNNLPKTGNSAGIGVSMSNITRDFRDLSTAGFIQNFQSLLKEGESNRYSKEEQFCICCILTTAEYCLETTQQLEEKLKEKTDKDFMDSITFSREQDIFHNIIFNCIQLLVQDLELACDPALTSMIKISWSSIESVGDQSAYVSTIVSHLRQTIPSIRDKLSACRKYFTQLCVKFASAFIPKLVQQLYKCKPLSTVGAEQLLLDVHMLKTALLDLPTTGCSVPRKAPVTYTKVVVKGMTTAEMILKVAMSPIDSPNAFTYQCMNLLPNLTMSEFQKILEMKGLRKTDQVQLLEEFKQKRTAMGTVELTNNIHPDNEAGRIKRLEKLIKKRT